MINDYLEKLAIENMDKFVQWAKINHEDHEACLVADELKLYDDGIATGREVLDAVVATEGDDWQESWEQFLTDAARL